MAINYEGFGAQAVGGANSTDVRHVTTAAQFTAALGSNRTILFDADLTITGSAARVDLAKITNLTIDANGHNVTIDNGNNGDGISFNGSGTHHCILKGVRVINAGGDGINVIDGAHDILITNCSAYNNRDGNIDVAADNAGQTKNVTVQWCIIGPHSGSEVGGSLITGQSVTFHHNFFVPASPNLEGERCPFVHCNYSPVGSPNADVRNNLVWKFGRNNGTGSGYGTAVGYNATANVVNNYYYTAGTSPNSAVANGDGYGTAANGKLYVTGNVSGNSGVNPNNVNNHAEYAIPAQFAVTIQDACTAAQLVLANAGPAVRNSSELGWINSVTLPGCSTTPPANKPPVANAGADQTLTLPTNSVILAGSGSDVDGTIAAFLWTKVSGGTATISGANTATATVTGLQAGSYVFRLTVTDDKGATATDDVIITVTPAPNNLPTVSAGADQTIKLPVNSVTLTGTAADSDGNIATTVWTKVSGNGGTITNPNSLSTDVTGLTAGTYAFRLTATDNGGASAVDNVTITVQPADVPTKTIVSVVVNYSDGSSQTLI